MLEVIIIEYNEITLLVLRYFDESKERTPIYFCRQTSKRCKKSTFVDLFLRVLRGELFLEGKICVVLVHVDVDELCLATPCKGYLYRRILWLRKAF